MRTSRVASKFLQRVAMALSEAYHVLGVSPSDTFEDIKATFKQKILHEHPDRGGDTQKAQDLIEAFQLIKDHHHSPSGHGGPSQGGGGVDHDDYSWMPEFIRNYRPKRIPKTETDIHHFVEKVLHKGYTQSVIRSKTMGIPMTALYKRMPDGTFHFTAPIGSVMSSRKLPIPKEKDSTGGMQVSPVGMIVDAIMKFQNFDPHRIVSMEISDRYGAWIIFEMNGGHYYQAICFERPKVREKKDPNVGMTEDAIKGYLRSKGFTMGAGAQRYEFWCDADQLRKRQDQKVGYFVRFASKSIRVGKRARLGGSIEFLPVAAEVYYGKVTPDYLDKVVAFIKARQDKLDNTPNPDRVASKY